MCVWGGSLRFSAYEIISFANRDSFTFSFAIWMSFISFSCLIALANTISTMLNRNRESGHVCLALSLGRKLSDLIIKCDVSCGFFIDALNQLGKVPFYSWFVEYFYH